MRLLLALVLVNGLAPGLAEVGESAVHFVRTGHAAHSAADEGDLGDQGAERGCGTTLHHCRCCAPQAVVPAGGLAVAALHAAGSRSFIPCELEIAPREPDRPFRPPIA